MEIVGPVLKWFESIDLKPRHLFIGITIVGAILLLLPKDVSTSFGLNSFPIYIKGTIFVITLLFLMLSIVSYTSACSQQRATRQSRDETIRYLDSLSTNELKHICQSLKLNESTIVLNGGDPFALGLCHKGILENAGTGKKEDYTPFIFPEHIWQYLIQHKQEIYSRARAKGINPENPYS